MPSEADIRRSYLLSQLGLGSSTLSNSDLEQLLYTAPITAPRVSSLKKFRQSLRNTRKGTTSTKVVCVGTSITYGYGASNYENDNFVATLIDLLNAYVCPTYMGLQNASGANISGGNKRSFWTLGTGWTTIAGYGMAGGAAANGTAGAVGNLDFGPFDCDGFTVKWMRRSTTSTFDIWVDGGAHTATGGSGTDSLQTTTISAGSMGAHTLHVGNIGAGALGAIILSVEPTRSTGGLFLSNLGFPSATSSSIYFIDGNPWQGPNQIWDDYQPTLSIIGVGTNDYSNNISPTTFQTNLTNMVTKAKLYGDCVLWVEPERTDVTGRAYPWSEYVKVIKTVAAANSLLVVDLNGVYGGNITAQGGIFDSNDHVHPSTEGHYQIALAVYNLLLGK